MLTDKQIKHMVDRFLGWRLPNNFSPDAGISFKAAYNEGTAHPMKHEPTGTNLFDATQADAMVRYLLEGMPDSQIAIYEIRDENTGAVRFCGTLSQCTAWWETRTGKLVENAGTDPAEPKKVLQ